MNIEKHMKEILAKRVATAFIEIMDEVVSDYPCLSDRDSYNTVKNTVDNVINYYFNLGNKKPYKSYQREYIGSSDTARLILCGNKSEGLTVEFLHFLCDGSYYAYIVDESVEEIPEHYTKVTEFEGEMYVYDYKELTKTFNAEKIIVYRAGNMGCIIQLIGGGWC